MNIGETIRNYRLQKGMSQGDIEKRTGLLRCYLSRVENGHTIPSLDTLAKIASAMELPLSQFFPIRGIPMDQKACLNFPKMKCASSARFAATQPASMTAIANSCWPW
jgi:transcriptional regulator with XRE-family HTH domain